MTRIKNKYTSVVRITFSSYDHKLLKAMVQTCMDAVTSSGGYFKGPVPMPNRRHLTTLLTSPHVYKTAMEQFHLTIHKYILDVYCGPHTLSMLKEAKMGSGVEIQISVRKGMNDE